MSTVGLDHPNGKNVRFGATREYRRQYYQANRTRILAQQRQFRRANPELVLLRERRKHLKRKYDKTPEQISEMFEQQGRVCKICKTDHPGNKTGQWHTDHDHVTKIVRGILCHHCNISLGKQVNPEILRRMADYLEGKL